MTPTPPPAPAVPTPEAAAAGINDDVFEYDNGGMTQCISGFGENTLAEIRSVMRTVFEERRLDNENFDRVAWHVRELVRWCRGLNRQAQERAARLAALAAENRRMRDDRAVLVERLTKAVMEAPIPYMPHTALVASGDARMAILTAVLAAVSPTNTLQLRDADRPE